MATNTFSLFDAPSPVVTIQKFATMTGCTTNAIRNQVQRGYWPTITIGNRIFINLARVSDDAIKEAKRFDNEKSQHLKKLDQHHSFVKLKKK